MAGLSQYKRRQVTAVIVAAGLFVLFLIFNPAAYQYITSEGGSFIEDVASVQAKDETKPDSTTKAIDVLNALAVHEKNTSEKYYRKLFYDDWGLTASGCNTREAILTRDLEDKQMNGCKVQSGTLNDPYTGQTINFQRGQDTSAAVQIDHVVALSNAWATGAYQLDEATRYQISQDPLNLVAVDGSANQEKSDQDASDWLPSNQAFRCQYVARQISVKYKYHLWVTAAEKVAMQKVLATCPNEPTVGLEQ